jgi:hypothetical protein
MKGNRDKHLIFVGWVEARNPTYQIELDPTYLKPDFSLWIRPAVFENVRKVFACRTPVLG